MSAEIVELAGTEKLLRCLTVSTKRLGKIYQGRQNMPRSNRNNLPTITVRRSEMITEKHGTVTASYINEPKSRRQND